MAKQIINRGASAGDVSAETLYAAFGKAISNFDELYAADAAADATIDRNASNKRPIVLCTGDSKTLEPYFALQLACGRIFSRVQFGGQLYNSASGGGGGTNSGTGQAAANKPNLIDATRLADGLGQVSTLVAAGYRVIIVLKIGYNDVSAGIGVDQGLANVRTFCEAHLAAGVDSIILMSVDPTIVSSYTAPNDFGSRNMRYLQYARSRRGIYFVDTTHHLTDPTSTYGTVLGNGTDTNGSASADGIHMDSGIFRQRSVFDALAAKLFAPGSPKVKAANIYHSSLNPLGDFMSAVSNKNNSGTQGGCGRHLNIGGANTSWTPAGGTPPLGWASTVSSYDGTLAITFSQALCPLWNTYTGLAAYGVKIDFSGTPTSDGQLTLERRPSGFGIDPSVTPCEFELSWLFETNALTGITGLGLSSLGTTPVFNNTIGVATDGSSKTASDAWPAFTDLLEINAYGTSSNGTSPGVDLTVAWAGGVPLSGSLTTIGATLIHNKALP